MSTEDTFEDIDLTQDDASADESATETDAEDTATETDGVEYTEREKKLFARAKAAEEKLRKLKAQSASKAEEKPSLTHQSDVTAEELRLIARGLSDEEIDEAKAIAKGKGITLSEALKTKTFIALQKTLKEEQRKEEAKLAASRGSGSAARKDVFRSGMTDEEHEKAWRESQGL